MVGPTFKTMKSEFVTWQEAISAKKYDLHNEKKHDQPEGDFMQRNMNRSQQNWVKTFMQDVMDEKGLVLFDKLAWLVKKLCLVMTSASACENMWIIEGCIHNNRRNRLVQPNIERTVCDHVNLVLRNTILLSKDLKVSWDLLKLSCSRVIGTWEFPIHGVQRRLCPNVDIPTLRTHTSNSVQRCTPGPTTTCSSMVDYTNAH
jgi:hypothetical protein